MRKNDKSFTFRLSEELLEAANEAAAQDNRKLTTYLRALIVKDCESRHISIRQAPPPEGTLRLDSVSYQRHLNEEIDGPDEPS
jgi:hypothetical protein